jgi:hypothetical protein
MASQRREHVCAGNSASALLATRRQTQMVRLIVVAVLVVLALILSYFFAD